MEKNIQSNYIIYNGIPIYKVNFNDFSYILECHNQGTRILSKNLQTKDFKDYYTKPRRNRDSFGIVYEGVVVDFRQLKNHLMENIE